MRAGYPAGARGHPPLGTGIEGYPWHAMKAWVVTCTLKKSVHEGNAWPGVHERLDSEWSETDDQGRPAPGNRVAGVVVTERGHDWARSTGRAMAANLLGVARALAQRPLGPPPR
ncbi:hypothetical protein [Streptomyces venetus]|uniref:hypothetical protein n=1 Tax=Streptomyces venetus TaxID=1701086 RepID=UPI003C2B408A